jgi:MFS family permease
MLIVITATSTILQTIVEDEKRGRVMSLYTMSFLGMVPMGSLAAGVVADLIGAPLTLALSGAGCIGAGLILRAQLPLLRAHIRAHYVRLGIVRE